MQRFLRKLIMQRKRWQRREDGAAAVEFALVAIPFFWLFIGIIELGLLMIFNNGIEDGVDRAGRLIRTGQAQGGSISAADFRNKICDFVVLRTACRSKLIVDVRTFPDFASIGALPEPEKDDTTGELKMDDGSFDVGSAQQVVMVRAFYQWKFITPLIGTLLSNTGDGRTFLVSAGTTFRNEPFGTND